MPSFIKKNTYFFSLLGIFLFCEWIVNPTGEFPLNDDWSYAKSILTWLKEGRYDLGEWPAMTLVTHLAWGLLFTKIGGFSFFVLRLSTLVSSFIGIWILFKIVRKITQKELVAFIASLVLLFNPIYFNLSNTFMTDVNFNTLLLLACYFVLNFFENQKLSSYLLIILFSALLVLTRQFGLVIPLSFMITCLLLSHQKWKYIALSLLGFCLVIFLLKLYEHYLRQILPANGAYKYSGNINITQRIFWDTLFENFGKRYATIIMHALVYTFPFSIIYLLSCWREIKWKIIVASMVIISGLTWLIFKEVPFPMGNIFINFDVGTETFFESMSRDTTRPGEHNGSGQMESIMHGIRYCFIALSALTLFFTFGKLLKKMRSYNSKTAVIDPVRVNLKKLVNKLQDNPFIVFLLLLALSYSSLLLITESYFDRYHLPLITIFIILFSYLNRIYTPKPILSFLLLIVMCYASVGGTKDYFTWNSKRWEAYYYLTKKQGVKPEKINAGFEPNCWNEGRHSWWYLMFELKPFDYLIQYWEEPGFKPYKEFPFKRWFLPKDDKINIFVRDSLYIPKK
jgi:4-amino-4-deoxy-L-arabinose transferase-like glycosyltransferase